MNDSIHTGGAPAAEAKPARRRFLRAAVGGVAGAAAMTAPMVSVAQSPIVLKMQGAWGAKDIFNEAFVVKNEKTGEIMANVPYRMESAGGVVIEGITDAMGRTKRLFTSKQEEVKLFLKDQD